MSTLKINNQDLTPIILFYKTLEYVEIIYIASKDFIISADFIYIVLFFCVPSKILSTIKESYGIHLIRKETNRAQD